MTQALVELQAFGVGTLLRPAQFDTLLGQQRLAVGTEQAHRQFLALAAKAFVGKQRLGRALAVARIGFVVQQRLLQGQGRGVAAVVPVIGDITANGLLGHFGLVARIVVAPGQVRQQPGTADGPVLFPGIALLDRRLEGRVIAQGQVIGVQQPQGLDRRAAQQAQQGQVVAPGSNHSSTNAM